ncbi:hypothetical protein OGATHE_004297 [Ogataea polymorpha]|uniref:Uncharacterized protein n=1 Tax=Ogataea polymorpha TaxID=460523 RepID=A0A9P8T2H3_9ASCO|nr:hypothetical protein OGATHE_004297 [Ogataea polymorpha]
MTKLHKSHKLGVSAPELGERSVVNGSVAVQEHDFVRRANQRKLMGCKNACLVLEVSKNALVHYELAHLGVHSTQNIVQHDDVSVSINCSGKVDARLLAPRESDTTLPHLCELSSWQLIKVSLQGAHFNNCVVLFLIERPAKRDIVLHGGILHPRDTAKHHTTIFANSSLGLGHETA